MKIPGRWDTWACISAGSFLVAAAAALWNDRSLEAVIVTVVVFGCWALGRRFGRWWDSLSR
jgi:hypothetical protein